jgi:hypothetical protein
VALERSQQAANAPAQTLSLIHGLDRLGMQLPVDQGVIAAGSVSD